MEDVVNGISVRDSVSVYILCVVRSVAGAGVDPTIYIVQTVVFGLDHVVTTAAIAFVEGRSDLRVYGVCTVAAVKHVVAVAATQEVRPGAVAHLIVAARAVELGLVSAERQPGTVLRPAVALTRISAHGWQRRTVDDLARLSHAVRWHLEDRILVDGGRTVVFERGQAPERGGSSISNETMTVFW